ncbi:MAG: hypothetical protein M3Q03_19560 [Chloroflexota bacterium]|nr:hypothetical protein [Chloroflexota bacterium]
MMSSFLTALEHAALVDELFSRLCPGVYESGTAADVLTRWLSVPEREAIVRVDQATITSESEVIAKSFVRS